MENQLTTLNNFENGSYSSIKIKSQDDLKRVYNALETCDKLLNDCVGEEIDIKDIYIESFISKHDNTEGNVKYRTILFADDGTTYVTTAYGVFNALRKIVSMYGEPSTWETPLKVQVVKRSIGHGKETLTLKLI